jgi:peptide/nickel transport system ATP-binding protein
MNTVLQFEQVCVEARDRNQVVTPILQSVDLKVEMGERLGIVGGSGSGKSTLLRIAAGVLSPGLHLTSGTVSTVGVNMLNVGTKVRQEMYGSSVALVAQSLGEALTSHLTIRAHFRDTLGRDVADETILSSLDDAGLDGAKYLHRYPHQISGGERQRVLLALALVRSPSLLLLDEPTSALDVGIAADVLATITRLQESRGFALVCVSHDFGVVGRVCDRLAVMSRGQIVEQGSTDQVLANPSEPYTQSLLSSIPRLHVRIREPQTIVQQPVVVARDLIVIRSGSTRALDSVNLEVGKGEVVGIIGESGSGKSTLLSVMCGLVPHTSGSMRDANGFDLTTPLRDRPISVLSQIQMVFQNPDDSLNPVRTVEQSMSRYTHANRDEVVAALEAVELSEQFLLRRPSEMSGGEKQRVAVARALLSHPQLLLLDEVTSALDVTVQASVVKMLASVQAATGMSMVIVSHDIALIASFADRLIVLRNGRVVEQGPVGEVVESPTDPYTQHLVKLAATTIRK